MPVNGLSSTDLRRDFHASGFLVRFAERVKQLYAQEGVKTNGLRYEPRIAHNAMKSLVFEQPNITVFRHARLASVQTERSDAGEGRKRVRSVQIEELDPMGTATGTRVTLEARAFIDATDCGDLAAWAGAKFLLGREPRSKQEPHNGVIYYNRQTDGPLPGSTGEGDTRIQSYAYLFVVKDYGEGVDKTIPKPPGYKREDFIHSPGWKDSWAYTSGKLPQNKYELNQHPQGGDLQEINYGYPTSDYAVRAHIEQLYRDHVLGYLYYIQTELGQKQLGAPDDEYRDTGGFPPLLYVREGRRIIGEQLPVEADITKALSFVRPESVGLGDYPMDSHAVRVKTDWNTPDMGEGEWWLYKETPWHQLPLGILIPKGLDNVWVTTAVSSTHVSFGTYRLEPVRMAFGQAAAISAYLSLRYHKIARDVPVRQVQDELLPHVAAPAAQSDVYLSYLSDVRPTHRHYRAIQYLVSRGFSFGEETFKPDAPTTGKELAQMLQKLAERGGPPARVLARTKLTDGTEWLTIRQPYAPYMGHFTNPRSGILQRDDLNTDTPVTRATLALWLCRVLNWPTPNTATSHYADVSGENQWAIEALYDHFIDSELWDGLGHRTAEGKLLFKPDTPLSHADLFATLYLAQIGLGPLFNDNPADGINGFPVPSPLYETVTQSAP
jgi:FAD dependent oxidoreductase/S-layer homology domain